MRSVNTKAQTGSRLPSVSFPVALRLCWAVSPIALRFIRISTHLDVHVPQLLESQESSHCACSLESGIRRPPVHLLCNSTAIHAEFDSNVLDKLLHRRPRMLHACMTSPRRRQCVVLCPCHICCRFCTVPDVAMHTSRIVHVSAEDSHFATAIPMGFTRLFKYLSGANEDSKKLKMTTPVRLHSLVTAITSSDPHNTRLVMANFLGYEVLGSK